MADFTWVPDQGATAETSSEVFEARFGDGYAQATSRGINSVSDEWRLNFSVRPRAEVDAIKAFLKARRGVTSFTWVTPEGNTQRFVAKSWSAVYNHDWDCSISVTFKQWFGQ